MLQAAACIQSRYRGNLERRRVEELDAEPTAGRVHHNVDDPVVELRPRRPRNEELLRLEHVVDAAARRHGVDRSMNLIFCGEKSGESSGREPLEKQT